MRHCYLCRKNPARYLFSKNGYPIYQCTHCGLGWAELDKPYEEFVRQYYDDGYFKGQSNRCAYDNYEKDYRFMKRNFQGMLKALRTYVAEGRLLDVGCATGRFMQLAKRHGYDAYGVEPSTYAAGLARKRFGDRVQESTIARAQFHSKQFHVITMLDVFEHLDDPRRALALCRKWLQENGLLVIATNNFDSLWAQLMGKRWHFLIPPQHLFFFSEKTIRTILQDTGFMIETISRPGKWITLGYGLHLARSIQGSRVADQLYRVFRRTKLLSLPLYINFFDHMVVYARKRS